MSADSRRRLGAITALVLGLFVGVTLLPLPLTGPIGHALGDTLWSWLGAGALGIPLLGVGLALAGFERLGTLDMKRSAFLIVGLSILLPYLTGVVWHVTVADLDNRRLLGKLVGAIPGFFAVEIPQGIGPVGAGLVGFLALSALTLATFAWHPLQRLERQPEMPLDPVGERADVRTEPKRKATAAKPGVIEAPTDAPAREELPGKAAKEDARAGARLKPKPAKKPEPRRAPGEKVLKPVWKVGLLAERTKDIDAGEGELDALQERLEETLAEFKVEGDVAGRTTGPVVTQYGVRLRPGVKMNRLVNLADDLALKMSARSIRVARIPGRDMVGVEVPNPKARIVVLRELVEDEQWQAEERLLPVALGLDLEGRPVIADLARMPHLLIAGATGTGKSVAINAIVTSLIYHYQHKEDLRFLMIDPKMVELSMYKDLPHLRHPVVTNNKEAARALKWAVNEMERRYALLEANG
ncbi:MAG: DNA translocase FtsK, partial [Gemmatimonadales bacterium]